jgi:hypothetical protein
VDYQPTLDTPSLTIASLNRSRYTLAIVRLSRVESEFKLIQIIRQVLFAYRMKRSHNTAFEQGENAFDTV